MQKYTGVIRRTLTELRRQVEKKIKAMDVSIEGYLLNSVVNGQERNGFSRRLDICRKALEENPTEPDNILLDIALMKKEIQETVKIRMSDITIRIETLKRTFEEHNEEFPPELQTHLDKSVNNWNLTDAEEFIALADKSLQSGNVNIDRIIPKLDKARWYESFMENLPLIQQRVPDIQTFKTRVHSANTGIQELDNLDQEHRKERAEVLGWWHDLSTGRKKNLAKSPRTLSQFLRWLGFSISNTTQLIEVKKTRQGPPNFWQHINVEAHIEAPIPRFGTSAHGRHSIVLAWNKLEDDQIAQWLSGNRIGKEQPVTILYFNGMNETSRRQVILATRKQGYSPVIIDNYLLAWLCHINAALERTQALFGICLTGGHCNPYTPEVAGSVPPEMFFGRTRDIEKLWKVDGPCIIYGGRQLGKSALLQQIVRHHHNPKFEQYVLCSGAAKHSSNIWDLFRQMLIEGALLEERSGSLDPNKIKSRIKELLDKTPTMRLLLLIDECDNLLEKDSRQNFESMNLVRDLMTETGRRFKVVLAGLHNVQRYQRIPNQPLAHFGEPICIGPLEPADGLQLVENPLETLGYRFDPPELVQRILANTNYHPSLIQLFCHELVDSMLSSSKRGINVPPFVIDEGFITSVYRKVSLEKKMRDRFDWTLDLDPRYRAIGYTFAWLELTEKPDPSCIETKEGYRVEDILSHVSGIWANGFIEANVDELTGLLDELVGLGVLLGVTGRRYRLRSPNILRLLGGEENILSELERFSDKDFDKPYIPQVVHRILPKGDNNGVSSPLTLHQESELLQSARGINLVMGSKATGIDRTVKILENLFSERSAGGYIRCYIKTFTDQDHANQIVSDIKTLYQKQLPKNSIRVIIDSGEMINDELFQALITLAEWLTSLRTGQRFLRIICLLDPQKVLALRSEHKGQKLVELQGVNLITLRRWSEAAQLHWFNDVNRPPSDIEQPRRWLELT